HRRVVCVQRADDWARSGGPRPPAGHPRTGRSSRAPSGDARQDRGTPLLARALPGVRARHHLQRRAAPADARHPRGHRLHPLRPPGRMEASPAMTDIVITPTVIPATADAPDATDIGAMVAMGNQAAELDAGIDDLRHTAEQMLPSWLDQS